MKFTAPLIETRLIISEKEVYLRDNNALISLLSQPGQMVLPLMTLDLEPTVSTIRSAAERLKMPRKSPSQSGELEGSRNGREVIPRTRKSA